MDTGLVGKEEGVCAIILTPIRFYLSLHSAMAGDMCSLSVPHMGPFKEALDPVFAFMEHIALGGHECYIHVLTVHSLQMGSRAQGVIIEPKNAGIGSQGMSGHRTL